MKIFGNTKRLSVFTQKRLYLYEVFKLKMIDNSNATYATGEEFALPAGNELYRLIAHNHAVFSSGGDLTTNAAGIANYLAAHPLQPVSVTTVVNPDGTVSLKLPPGLPNYGTN